MGPSQKQKIYILVILACLLFLGLFFQKSTVSAPEGLKTIKMGNATIVAEPLTTKPQWIQGLSGKTSLAPNTGDLFVFDRSDYWGIWMKDMLFSIDVVWITADFKVSDIVENMTPESYPTDYKPHQPVLYVLEIPAGTVAANQIKIGQDVSIK